MYMQKMVNIDNYRNKELYYNHQLFRRDLTQIEHYILLDISQKSLILDQDDEYYHKIKDLKIQKLRKE